MNTENEREHNPRRGRRKGNTGLIKIAIIAIVVVIAVFVIAFLIGKKSGTDTDESLIEESTEISETLLRENLADIGEMATQEYYFTEIGTYDSSKKIKNFEVPFTTTRFVYSYDGMIKAGIDFASVEVEKNDLTKIITVKVPKSRILSSEIDENSFQIYDEEQSIFNQLSISNFNDTTAQMKANAEEKAIKKGLLDNADANAKLIINNFIASFDISDYTVTVVTAE